MLLANMRRLVLTESFFQVCNAVYVRLNWTQPLCACPSRYRDPCSASLNTDDQHTTELMTEKYSKVFIKLYTNLKKNTPICMRKNRKRCLTYQYLQKILKQFFHDYPQQFIFIQFDISLLSSKRLQHPESLLFVN